VKILLFTFILFTMSTSINAQKWLNQSLYPFESRYLQLPEGKMHYLDEGIGETIVFVHGTPAWSFLYRNYIRELSKSHRCIAIDHLGFGLSEKPVDFPGTPEAHAQNLALLLESLDLNQFTLVVHDFGGPIGLSYAIANPEKVERVVMFNTWLWETKNDPAIQKVDRILNSRLGRFLYLRLNFSPKVLLKKAFYDKKKLSKAVHRHYKKPFPDKKSRFGLLNIGKSLLGSSDWYKTQWEQIEMIKDKPFLVLWGMKDAFITEENLQKWERTLGNAEIHRIEAGHFVQEEKFSESLGAIQRFLR
jgi:haloalkane dehalogenase